MVVDTHSEEDTQTQQGTQGFSRLLSSVALVPTVIGCMDLMPCPSEDLSKIVSNNDTYSMNILFINAHKDNSL